MTTQDEIEATLNRKDAEIAALRAENAKLRNILEREIKSHERLAAELADIGSAAEVYYHQLAAKDIRAALAPREPEPKSCGTCQIGKNHEGDPCNDDCCPCLTCEDFDEWKPATPEPKEEP